MVIFGGWFGSLDSFHRTDMKMSGRLSGVILLTEFRSVFLSLDLCPTVWSSEVHGLSFLVLACRVNRG